MKRVKLIPIKPLENGRWVSPEVAAKLAWNGRGITIDTMMNNIYAGKLNGFVKQDHLGSWLVWIEDEQTELKTAA